MFFPEKSQFNLPILREFVVRYQNDSPWRQAVAGRLVEARLAELFREAELLAAEMEKCTVSNVPRLDKTLSKYLWLLQRPTYLVNFELFFPLAS